MLSSLFGAQPRYCDDRSHRDHGSVRTGRSTEQRKPREPFEKNFPLEFRARSAERERGRVLRPFSKNIKLEFGTEGESKYVLLSPGGERHDVISDLQYSQLEVDISCTTEKSNTEFVSKPSISLDHLDRGSKEEADITNLTLALAKDSGSTLVRVGDVLPNAPRAMANQDFELLSFAPTDRLQSSIRVSLANFHKLIDWLPSRKQRSQIRKNARLVEECVSRECHGIKLTKDIKGFIKLILYVMSEAERAKIKGGTAQAAFHFMHRTDYCLAYHEGLDDPDDRLLARFLLLRPKDNKQESLILRAIGSKGSERLFKRPYPNEEGTEFHDGPTKQKWFDSIIDGRGEGAYEKDLISPLDGYGLHTGDLAKDFPMGARGMDVDKKKLFFEIRGHKARTRVLRNAPHLRIARRQELKLARIVDPDMGDPSEIKFSSQERNLLKLRLASVADKLAEFRNAFCRTRDLSLSDAKIMIEKEKFKAIMHSKLRMKEIGWDKKYPDVYQGFTEFFSEKVQVSKFGSSQFTGTRFLRALDALMDTIWKFDPTADQG